MAAPFLSISIPPDSVNYRARSGLSDGQPLSLEAITFTDRTKGARVLWLADFCLRLTARDSEEAHWGDHALDRFRNAFAGQSGENGVSVTLPKDSLKLLGRAVLERSGAHADDPEHELALVRALRIATTPWPTDSEAQAAVAAYVVPESRECDVSETASEDRRALADNVSGVALLDANAEWRSRLLAM